MTAQDSSLSKEPKAVRSFLRGFEETLTYLEYSEPVRSAIKTNNPLERYLEELQRRIKPFREFANLGSVDRIVYGIVAYPLETREPITSQFYTINLT